MTNRQLASILATVVILAAMGLATALVLWGGDRGMTLLYEIGGGLSIAVAGILAIYNALPDRDRDGIPDAFQSKRKKGEEE